MEKFKDFKIDNLGLNSIYGGLQYVDTEFGSGSSKKCDCLEDTNDNGRQDPGECAVVIEC